MPTDPTPERVLVLTPTGRDGPMIAGVLERSGMRAEVCADIGSFCRAWEAGAGGGVSAGGEHSPTTDYVGSTDPHLFGLWGA